MNRTIALMAGCLLSVASLGVQAQAPAVRLNMDTGLYIGAGVGKARITDRCCDAKDETWNVFVGYQFNRHFAIEGGYSDFGEGSVIATLAGVPVTDRIKATAWELVGVGSLPITDQWSLYAKLGIFRYESDASSTGALIATSSETGTEFTVGAGVQYAFTRNFAARFELQSYTEVGAGVIGAEKDDITVWRLAARYKF